MKRLTGAILAGAALAAGSGAWGEDDPGRREALRKLDSQKVSVDFRDATLALAIDYVREVTGLNIVVSPRAAEKDPDAKVTLKVRDVSARVALRLLLRPQDLSATWKDGALQVVTREELGSDVVLRMYDVRACLVKIQDFSGPKMELTSPDARNSFGIEVIDDPPPKDPPVSEDMLLELVRTNTGRKSWDENPRASIQMANGMLVVSQTPAVHREVEQLLRKLQQYR